MTASQVVLWRHGQTDSNAAGIVQGQRDTALNATGIYQARSGAGAISSRFQVGRIIASDLQRAWATANELAALVTAEVITDTRLRERSFGPWEGQSRQQVKNQWGSIDADCDQFANLVEPRAAVARRGVDAISEHYQATPDGSVLVVATHGQFTLITVAALLELDVVACRNLLGRLGNAHYATLKFGGDVPWFNGPDQSEQWQLQEYNIAPLEG